MGREIKRVSLDFDWPVGEIWPGYMLSICSANDSDCDKCHHFASLVNLTMTDHNCPSLESLAPPGGEGYQLWSTTTEGHPMSPVFATPEELARWLADTGASAFAGMTLPYEKWLAFIVGPGWACSAIADDKGLRSGVEAMME
jgi:hypothetical protein